MTKRSLSSRCMRVVHHCILSVATKGGGIVCGAKVELVLVLPCGQPQPSAT